MCNYENSDLWATYVTIYRGNKLPPFYIGYSSIYKFKSGYKGSVKSKKYKDIWKKEITDNSHLFDTKILTRHKTKQEALDKEEYFQKHFSVHKNDLYINQNITGKFFTSIKGRKLSESHKIKIGMANSISLKGKKFTEERKQKLKRKKHTKEDEQTLKDKIKIPWNKGLKGYNSGVNHYRYGTKLTPDIKKKISEKLKNNKCRVKKYKIIDLLGNVQIISNMKNYCDVNLIPYKS